MRPSKQGQQLLPVCINQEHLLLTMEWFESQAARFQPSIIQTAVLLNGSLDYRVLEQSLLALVRRHAALRTAFCAAPDVTGSERMVGLQKFGAGGFIRGFYRHATLEDVPLDVRFADLSDLSEEDAAAEAACIASEEGTRPFDHQRAPLLRAVVLKRQPDRHTLLLALDHLIADAWSMRILRRELFELYRRFSGLTATLSEQPLQYYDYALWQAKAIEDKIFDKDLIYWRDQWSAYGGARLMPQDLPFRLPKPLPEVSALGEVSLAFDDAATNAIRQTAKTHRLSLHMLFLAGYAVLLYSYTGQDRVAIWNHFSNRVRPDVLEAVGYFVHSHLIGIDLVGNPTCTELFHRVRGALLDAYDHQQMPLPLLWNALNCHPRYADSRVLVDYNLMDEPLNDGVEVTPGLTAVIATFLKPPVGRFSSLGMYIKDTKAGLVATIGYSASIFSDEGIAGFLADFRTVMNQLTTDPNRRVSSLLSGVERKPRSRRSDEMEQFVLVGSNRIPRAL